MFVITKFGVLSALVFATGGAVDLCLGLAKRGLACSNAQISLFGFAVHFSLISVKFQWSPIL